MTTLWPGAAVTIIIFARLAAEAQTQPLAPVSPVKPTAATCSKAHCGLGHCQASNHYSLLAVSTTQHWRTTKTSAGAAAFDVRREAASIETRNASDLGFSLNGVAELLGSRCHWYSPGRSVLPCVLVAILAGLSLAMQLRWATRPTEWQVAEEATAAAGPPGLTEASQHRITAEVARTIGCYFAVLDSIVFTMVIPDSYDIVLSLGGNAILSGAMIGAHKFGTAGGAVGFFCALRRFPGIWRTRARITLLLCALCNVFGTATYAVIAAASDKSDLSAHQTLSRILLVFLFVGRITGGVGSGIRLMIVRTQIARLTPRAQRPFEQSRFLFAVTLGMGLGPLLAAVVKRLDVCQGSHSYFLPTGVAGFALSLCQIVAALQIRPVTDAPDLLDREEAIAVALLDREEIDQRRCFIFCGLAFSMLRGLCLSGVEAASALLLEVRFGWHPTFIGLTIGLAFLTCIPWRMFYVRFRDAMPQSQWIQLLMAMSMLGSVFLFRLPEESLKLGVPKDTERLIFAGILLLGDGLLFPCFFLSDGIVQGLILQHPLPAETSLLNINGMNLMNTVLLDGFARVVGPALSRFHVSALGQNAYAAQQLILTVVAAAIALCSFLPNLRQLDEADKLKAGTELGSTKMPIPSG